MTVNNPDKVGARPPQAAGAADAAPLPPAATAIFKQMQRLLIDLSRLANGFGMVMDGGTCAK